MNREQRRKAEKNLRKKFHISQVSAEQIIKLQAVRQEFDIIPEGTAVKLNLDKTEKGNPKRNQWMEENKEKVFHVKYDPKYGEKPIMILLEEEPLWIWCINELTVVE
jgi:hypothetical protein